MTDIVERLREKRGILDNRWPGPSNMDLEAATEIEALRAALKTFAELNAWSSGPDESFGGRFFCFHGLRDDQHENLKTFANRTPRKP